MLRKALEELRRRLRAKTSAHNDINLAALDEDLGLMLALLQSKFVNANALERLMNTTLNFISKKAAEKLFDRGIEFAVDAALFYAISLLAKTWAQ